MKKEELEKIGIIYDGDKLKPNKYWINSIQEHISIYENNTIEDIFKYIYDIAEKNGIEEGKRRRSNEFKALLDDY